VSKFGKKMFEEHVNNSFKNASFKKPKQVKFVRANLNTCLFENQYSDISKVDFNDIKWDTRKSFLRERISVYDERFTTEKTYKNIEKIYGKLKANYDHSGLYKESGDFYHGMMEMKRLEKGSILKYISSLAFYKYLSGYGEQYLLALFWLLFGVFILLPGLYMLSDTNFDIANYTTALLYSVEIYIFKKSEAIKSITEFGKLVVIFQIIFVPLQAVLFFVAIKRRFKR
jgi:hypothetical protein